MEALLPKRIKYIIFLGLLAVIALVTGILFLQSQSRPTNGEIDSRVLDAVDGFERSVAARVEGFKARALFLYNRFKRGELKHADLGDNESLIRESQGVVVDHYGEIFHFKFGGIQTGEWGVIHRSGDLYFIQRVAQSHYYVSYLMTLRGRGPLELLDLPFLYGEFKFFDAPLADNRDNIEFDEVREMFFHSHPIHALNDQVLLHLKFPLSGVVRHYHGRGWMFLFTGAGIMLAAAFLFVLMFKDIKNRPVWAAFLSAGMFLCMLAAIRRLNLSDLYLPFPMYRLNSIYELGLVLCTVLMIVVGIRSAFKRWFQSPIVSFVLFNAAMLLFLLASRHILTSVDFYVFHFNLTPPYLVLLVSLILFHILSLQLIAQTSWPRGTGPRIVLIVSQCSLTAVLIIFAGFNTLQAIMFSSLLLVPILLQREKLHRLIFISLIGLSVFYSISHTSAREKTEFISENLANIFMNQRNYAKFIANEIAHEINSYSSDFSEFFSEDASDKLEEIWRNSIASRENIASGIFVLGADKSLLAHFSYMIPYLRGESEILFPFWAVGDATAEIYGRRLSLGMASISVFKEGVFIGQMIIEVVNSPELILRSQEKTNIFTMNGRIGGGDLSYVTLNEDNRIVENPANINIKDIAGMSRQHEGWISFSFMDTWFRGYKFSHDDNSTIIFFPQDTLVQKFSDLIRIFLLALLIYGAFHFKWLRPKNWRGIYYSFSIRVFFILILTSLFTAVFFSIFSLDFFSQSNRQQARWMMFESGRTAENILGNILEENGELEQDHLFLVSAILNKEINAYEGSELLFASNYRKIIQAQIPVFLHSRIVHDLEEKNQQFVFMERDGDDHLFFKLFQYVIHLRFPTPATGAVFSRGKYADFIIVLFFFLLVMGISSAYFLRQKIISPIEELNRGMEEVEKGNLYRLRTTPDETEIRSLYLGFNSMLDGIEEQKKNISEISRMKTLLKLGRRVAHEVKNPLTPIKLSAEQIRRSMRDKRSDYEEIVDQSVRFIIDETEHLKRVAYGFLDFSRLEEISPESFDLHDVVRDECTSFRSIYPNHRFLIKGDAGPLFVTWDRLKIKQVLKNIIINSIEAIGEKPGEVILTLTMDATRVGIEVSDNGIGLDREELELIFNEDYSTKEIGTGLGLFIVKRIVDLHGGSVQIQSEKSKGTVVKLEMPGHVRKT